MHATGRRLCPLLATRCSPQRWSAAAATRGDVLTTRRLSSTNGGPQEWRRQQLQKLEKKFDPPPTTTTSPTAVVNNQADLQPMWKAMEGRVTSRRPRTQAETGGRTGRVNVKATDEEYWLREGLYGNSNDEEEEEAPSALDEKDAHPSRARDETQG